MPGSKGPGEKTIFAEITGEKIMKKTYKIDVDCANCANEMEEAVKNVNGVKDCVVNFMTLKMKVDYEDGVDPDQMLPILKKEIDASGSDGVILD